MAENIGAEIRRDTELEQRMLEAVVADRNAQPRSQQLQVGPSQVGGCRELLRAGLFESDTMVEPETTWAAAAHVGSVMGDNLESIFGPRLDALTQQRITATFGMLGVQISGAVDLLFMSENQISDLKSTDDIGGVLYDLKRNASAIETLLAIRAEGLLYQKNIETPDGGYELTEVIVSKIAKLHYYVQVAIYVVGAIQQGILDGDATARLVFYDRSGNYQGFVALIVTREELDLFYDIAQMRLQQVVDGQMAYEGTGGNPAVIAHLRDKAPSYCYSPKVMCPRRSYCWEGSDWASDNRITDAEHISAVNRYIVGRDLEKLGKGMKMSARADLKDISGMLPDGKMVTWGGNGAINVVETTVAAPQTQARLDEYVPAIDVAAEVTAEHERTASGANDEAAVARTFRQKELEKLQKAELLDMVEQLTGERPVGVKAKLIGIILDTEAASPQPVDEPMENEAMRPRVEATDGRVLSDGDAADAGVLIVPNSIADQWVAGEHPVESAFTEMTREQVATEDAAHVAEIRQYAGMTDADHDLVDQAVYNADPTVPEEEKYHEPGSESEDRLGGIPVETALPDPDLTPSWTGAPTIAQVPFGEGVPEAPAVRSEQVTEDPQQVTSAFSPDVHRWAETGEPEGDAKPAMARAADGETRPTGVHFEDSGILQRRQALFGLTLEELTAVAQDRGVATDVPRGFMVQAILDVEFMPQPGRGWAPNGAGTSGDERTDRLRQMQYDADPAMRRNYENGEQR